MTEAKAVSPPRAFLDFCARHPEECRARNDAPARVQLTSERMDQLFEVQRSVNLAVSYRPDSYTFGELDFWEFPFVYGDCEDYALKKKRDLIALGWPRSGLLLTVVRVAGGGLHMVLSVPTDIGDIVLDNRMSGLALWSALDYRWLTRQSRYDESRWVKLAVSGAADFGRERGIGLDGTVSLGD
ncbi:MAG: transglutaminase-like cysteine peptidase [Rhodospirillales bacterium]|nr:transglutaminase-like cysteine peptidase [Rhodospirillales bacterium]